MKFHTFRGHRINRRCVEGIQHGGLWGEPLSVSGLHHQLIIGTGLQVRYGKPENTCSDLPRRPLRLSFLDHIKIPGEFAWTFFQKFKCYEKWSISLKHSHQMLVIQTNSLVKAQSSLVALLLHSGIPIANDTRATSLSELRNHFI